MCAVMLYLCADAVLCSALVFHVKHVQMTGKLWSSVFYHTFYYSTDTVCTV